MSVNTFKFLVNSHLDVRDAINELALLGHIVILASNTCSFKEKKSLFDKDEMIKNIFGPLKIDELVKLSEEFYVHIEKQKDFSYVKFFMCQVEDIENTGIFKRFASPKVLVHTKYVMGKIRNDERFSDAVVRLKK